MRLTGMLVAFSGVLLLVSCESSRFVDADNANTPVGPGPLVAPKAEPVTDDEKLAKAIANELTAAAPITSTKDEAARDAAAKRLKESALLDSVMAETVTWGGRASGTSFDPKDHELTKFNSMVYRSLYLSLFMFTGEYYTLKRDGYTVLFMPCFFRNELGMGAYPYPFWHMPGKWGGYQTAAAVEFVIDKGKIIGAYRSPGKNNDIFTLSHNFDGNWMWKDKSGKEMPYSTLYSYLLSGSNPHAGALDQAYRAFANEARKHNCMQCHDPENNDSMDKLTLLNYPNQTLTSRHEIVSELQLNSMPPKSKKHPAGIGNADERKKLLDLAKTFAEVGDKAMDFEKQQITGKKDQTSALPEPAPQR